MHGQNNAHAKGCLIAGLCDNSNGTESALLSALVVNGIKIDFTLSLRNFKTSR